MSVVDLDHRVIRQVIQSASLCFTLVQNELRARADHEILLINAKEPSLLIAVIRVEEKSQVLLYILFVKLDPVMYDRLIHGVNVKQMQLIRLVVISCHLNVIHTGIDLQTFKLHRINDVCLFQPGLLPDPRIRRFLLNMILKFLFEKSQVIIQTDAVARKPQCSDRIQKTCGKSSKPSVSEGRLCLCFLNLADVFSVLFQHLFYFLIDAQIDHIVGQQLPDQKLC